MGLKTFFGCFMGKKIFSIFYGIADLCLTHWIEDIFQIFYRINDSLKSSMKNKVSFRSSIGRKSLLDLLWAKYPFQVFRRMDIYLLQVFYRFFIANNTSFKFSRG